MAVRIRKNLNSLKQLVPRVKKRFSQQMRREIVDVIKEEILSGKSPVKGKRFKDYSKEYAIKKGVPARKPVDMFVTGKMLESLKAVKSRAGSIYLKFSSKIAVIHDKLGAGKSQVIRRLLPTNRGEVFKDNITREIIRITNDVVSNEVNKTNR